MGFDSFLGNRKAVATVRGMLASSQVPGALLFSGPEGVGKRTLAVMMAMAINCENRGASGDDFCGSCRSCLAVGEMLASGAEDLARRRDTKDSQKRTENLVYFDVQIVAPITRFILIEQIRQLCAAAYSRPFTLGHRIFILDEAHAIHWQATDLLLKLLEEPPETTTLILVCSNPYQLRTTIRSRCVWVDFAPAEDSIIETTLAQNREIRPAQRALALRLAAGSIAWARSPAFSDYEARRRPWLDFIGGLAAHASSSRGDWTKVLGASKAIASDRDNWEVSLSVGYQLCRDLLVSLSDSEGQLIINADLRIDIAAWAGKLGFERVAMLMEGLDESFRLRARNVNSLISLDALTARILAGPRPRAIPSH